jgi:hypothetical protein
VSLPPTPDSGAVANGLLLCTGRDEQVVRYTLASASAPLAVATYDIHTPNSARTFPTSSS